MSKAGTSEPAVGTIIDNKYRIDCLIGQGGMGKVFRVTHIHLNKVFALKFISVRDAKRLSRFRREAEALAKIHHPNVVMVTDFGVTPDDAPYIVMEFIEGMSLRQYLKMKGTLLEKEVIKIGKQVCAALYEAHVNNIIHRDLKPDNIMLQWLSDGDIMARVVDFGLAKLVESPVESNITEDREIPGTVKYMAPEQLCRLPIDHRTDIFSFCLIMYEVLTGQVPHVVVSKAKPIHELRNDVSVHLSDIITKGLSQQPSDRQQNVIELKREFEALEFSTVLQTVSGKFPAQPQAYVDSRSPSPEMRSHQSNISTNVSFGSQLPAIESSPPITKYIIIGVATIVILVLVGGGLKFFFSPSKEASPRPTNSIIEPLTDTALPTMIAIPGGKFKMGTNKGDAYAQPEHQEEVTPFKVSKYLITGRQYLEFVRRTKYRAPDNWINGEPSNDQLEKPIVNISWRDANAYCLWLSGQAGKHFRLISEKEWEFLARSKTDYEVAELLTGYVEWTSTPFYLYPNSPAKELKTDGKVYIFRGNSNTKEAKDQDPKIFRSWQNPDYIYANLSFRVISD